MILFVKLYIFLHWSLRVNIFVTHLNEATKQVKYTKTPKTQETSKMVLSEPLRTDPSCVLNFAVFNALEEPWVTKTELEMIE